MVILLSVHFRLMSSIIPLMCPNLSSYMTGLWSYGARVYNYLCLSKPAHGDVYSIQHYVIKFVSGDRSVVFSGYADFLHVSNWPPRYKWYIVKSAGKCHNPNPSFIHVRALSWLGTGTSIKSGEIWSTRY